MNIKPSQIADLIEIKRNDTSRLIYDTLYLNDGAEVLNLSGSSVYLAFYNTQTSLVTKATASIITAESGSVYYALTAGDVAATGSWLCEWQVNRSDGSQLSVPTSQYIKLNIIQDLEN